MKFAVAVLITASGLWSQQQSQPAPPRPPTIPLTALELDAIPLVAPRSGKTIKKVLFDGKTLGGWQGNPEWWSVQDGAIRGKFNDKVPTSFVLTISPRSRKIRTLVDLFAAKSI